MQIHQYIYTRLSAAESPHKVAGFQSAFVPEGLVGKLQPVNLEAHIHLPSLVGFVEKRVVFWEEIDHEAWQVILFIEALPEVRDEFGRGGAFMCHGFLIPPVLWQRYRSPLRIAHLLEQFRIRSVQALLSSPLVDRKKGTIQGIDPGVYPPDDEEQLLPPTEAHERAALALLYRIGSKAAKESSLVYKGSPKQAEAFFARMFALLPTGLKAKLSWDSAFDGGKLFFSPFRVVAYSAIPPVTGYQAVLIPSQRCIDYADEEQATLIQPFDAYSHWLEHCADASFAPATVNAVYALSVAIRDRLPYNGNRVSRCFARVNEPLIRAWLLEGTDPMLSKEWRVAFAEHLSVANLQALAEGSFSDEALARATADTILNGKLLPSNFKVGPYAPLQGCKEARLRVLSTMWTGDVIPKAALYDIVIEDRMRILALLAQHGLDRKGAAEVGFSGEEIEWAKPHFKGVAGRFFKRLFGS